MLIKFESKNGAQFVMLQDHAQVLLKMMGHEGKQKGSVSGDELVSAIFRLNESLKDAMTAPQDLAKNDNEDNEDDDEPMISWSSRATPLLELLSQAEESESFVMWRPE